MQDNDYNTRQKKQFKANEIHAVLAKDYLHQTVILLRTAWAS
jgi:hypothetical protein